MGCAGRVAFGLLLTAFCACTAGTPKQAESPDPPLDEPHQSSGASDSARASSGKVQRGIDAIKAEDFATAKSALSEARAETPNDPQAAYYLGVVNEQLGDREGAEKEYRAALALDPKLVEASANLSALLLDAGNASEALEIADRALKIDPKHPALLLNRALALETSGNKSEVLAAYAKAVEARPQDPELRLAYADLLIEAGEKLAAKAEVQAARDTEDPKLLAAVAHRFGKLGAPAECIAVLDRALRPKPNAELLVRRGVCRHDAGDDSGAVADYRAALETEPKSVPAHFYLGRHLAEKGDKKGAVKHLKTVVELSNGEGLGKAAAQALKTLK